MPANPKHDQTDQPKADQPKADPTKADAQTANGELPIDFLTAPVMLDASLAKVSQPIRERSDRQQAMDETVKRLHEHWAKVGKPTTWGEMVTRKCVATYFVQPDKAGGVKTLIKRAGVLHEVAIRWGSEFPATGEMVKRYNLPDEYEGRTVISFAVRDKRERAKNGTKSGEQLAAEANKASDEAKASK